MFIARHCDLLDVEIYCDGCSQTMPGRRYRCLECIDMDLCVTCFTGGVNPGGEHKDNHSFVYFMYVLVRILTVVHVLQQVVPSD